MAETFLTPHRSTNRRYVSSVGRGHGRGRGRGRGSGRGSGRGNSNDRGRGHILFNAELAAKPGGNPGDI